MTGLVIVKPLMELRVIQRIVMVLKGKLKPMRSPAILTVVLIGLSGAIIPGFESQSLGEDTSPAPIIDSKQGLNPIPPNDPARPPAVDPAMDSALDLDSTPQVDPTLDHKNNLLENLRGSTLRPFLVSSSLGKAIFRVDTPSENFFGFIECNLTGVGKDKIVTTQDLLDPEHAIENCQSLTELIPNKPQFEKEFSYAYANSMKTLSNWEDNLIGGLFLSQLGLSVTSTYIGRQINAARIKKAEADTFTGKRSGQKALVRRSRAKSQLSGSLIYPLVIAGSTATYLVGLVLLGHGYNGDMNPAAQDLSRVPLDLDTAMRKAPLSPHLHIQRIYSWIKASLQKASEKTSPQSLSPQS